LGRACP